MTATASRRHTTILGWVDVPAAGRGIRFASADGWDAWSWEQLAMSARRAAGRLIELGVGAGDVVVIVDESGPAFVAALFGAMLAGATPSPIAPPLAFQAADAYAAAIHRALDVARPAVVVAGERAYDRLAAPARTAGAVRVLAAELLSCNASPALVRSAPETALLQFTSGTTGRARAVRVTTRALEANLGAIRRWLRIAPEDGTASWLPTHHDMGLIGCLLTPAATGSDLSLMRPEQFLRDPLRYLRCFDAGGARLGAMPAFALDYVVRHVSAQQLEALDLRDWRALIVGSERVDRATLARFATRLAPAGFAPHALLPAYGLAEATLAVTGTSLGRRWRTATAACGTTIVGCGTPLSGVAVTIEDDAGRPVRDGCTGEVVVRAACVAGGYQGSAGRVDTLIGDDGALRTGDAGFVRDGELFVLGRFGDGLKIRGRFVLPEDVEAALVAAGLPARRCVVLLGHDGGGPTVVVVLEDTGTQARDTALRVVRRVAECPRVIVVQAPKGTIQRTTSGKPKRRMLWDAFVEGRLAGTVHQDRPVADE